MNSDSYIVLDTKIAFSLPLTCPPPYKNKCFGLKGLKKKAFTLAETLITLSIIGVVAAMTVPTLMSNQNDKITVTKLKKAQSILTNAVKMTQLDGNNEIPDMLKLSQHLKFTKSCGPDFQGSPTYIANDCNPFSDAIQLEDGIIFGYHFTESNNEYIAMATILDGKIGDALLYHGDEKKRAVNHYSFIIKHDGIVIPNGAPNTIGELKKEDTCPYKALMGDNYNIEQGCTYWTLKTGKVKKKAGEWF